MSDEEKTECRPGRQKKVAEILEAIELLEENGYMVITPWAKKEAMRVMKKKLGLVDEIAKNYQNTNNN